MISHRIETQDEDSCDDDPQDENFAEDEQELPSVLDIDFTTDELNSKCQAISLAQLLQQKEQGSSNAQDQTIAAEIRPLAARVAEDSGSETDVDCDDEPETQPKTVLTNKEELLNGAAKKEHIDNEQTEGVSLWI